jgi:hypothetical protein
LQFILLAGVVEPCDRRTKRKKPIRQMFALGQPRSMVESKDLTMFIIYMGFG